MLVAFPRQVPLAGGAALSASPALTGVLACAGIAAFARRLPKSRAVGGGAA